MHDGVPATTVAVYWRRFVNATSVGSVKALSKDSAEERRPRLHPDFTPRSWSQRKPKSAKAS